MSRSPQSRRRQRQAAALVISAGLHLLWVVPYGIHRLITPMRPKESAEIELAYVELPPEDAQAPEAPDEKPQPEAKPAKDEKPPEEKPPEPEQRPEKPKPEPIKPLLVIPNAHLKMVDQDQFPDEADNADARFLAQKNHRAAQETRAEQTNLVRNQAGEQQSSPSENEQKDPGDRDHKIAELADRAGTHDRLPANHQPTGDPAREARPQPAVGPLAMRDLTPKTAEQPERREGLEKPEAGAGPLPMARSGPDAQAAMTPRGGQPKLNLSNEDYDRIVGFNVAESERRAAALAERSHTPGRWDRVQAKQGMMRSALENFTPMVRPGNQSELGTRAHPFAAFLAQVHRQIHAYFGFDFLAHLPPNSAYNDPKLWTALEISLNGDGTLHRMVISHPSGNLGFDVAAMDSVMSASPFPAPPQVIKSRDGQVYLTWRFHRDDRQCATDFAEPHILTTPGPPPPSNLPKDYPRRPPPKEVGAPIVERGRPPGDHELLLRAPRASSAPRPSAPAAAASATPAKPASAGSATAGAAPRAPERPAAAAAPTPAPTTSAAPTANAALTPTVVGSGVPAAAREAAEKWLAAYNRGDARWLAGYSAVPFVTGGATVAEDADELRDLYRQLLKESPKHMDGLALHTAPQIRKRLGRLPPGGEEDDMIFGTLRGGTTDFVLLLQTVGTGWRVVGLNR